MKRVRLASLVFCGMLAVTSPWLSAYGPQGVPIQERAHGAERIVVATVAETSARYERNEFGDQLIVSRVRLEVEEAIKGSDGALALTLEGGTVDGITMRVSSLPTLARGERAVFFITPGPNGTFRPHLRGQGILRLDAMNRVRGSSLTLDEIRRLVGQALK
jgi:hypothetical protein